MKNPRAFDNFERLSLSNFSCEAHYWHKKGASNEYVILMHGAGCDHEMFEDQAEIFPERYGIIAWDARGHGASKLRNGKRFDFFDMRDDCLKLFEIHKIEKAILVGQSMGGNLAQEIAMRRPDLIRGLALIGCTKNAQKLTAREKALLKMSGLILRCYPWKFLVRQSANACGLTDHAKNYVEKCLRKIGKKRFIEIMMSLPECLSENVGHTFEMPVLLICGDADKTGNIKKALKQWAEEDPSCELCIIENAGHCANQDNPGAVNECILRFIKEINGSKRRILS